MMLRDVACMDIFFAIFMLKVFNRHQRFQMPNHKFHPSCFVDACVINVLCNALWEPFLLPLLHLELSHIYLLLAKFSVRTVNYGPRFLPSIYGPSIKLAAHTSMEKSLKVYSVKTWSTVSICLPMWCWSLLKTRHCVWFEVASIFLSLVIGLWKKHWKWPRSLSR